MKFELIFFGAAIFVALIWTSRLAAQDVIVGEPGWFQADGAPEGAPQFTSRFRPDYPSELRKTGEAGYVIVTRCLAATGEGLILGATGTHPSFRRAVEQTFENWTMRPAKRNGQTVTSWFWIPVIFNPASASPDGPDATPRLLAVTPVVVPPAMIAKLRDNTTAWGTISLDTAGVPKKVALEPPASDRLLPYIETALKQWRFGPARHGGQPTAADFHVAFLFYRPVAPVPTKQTLPRVVKQERPI
jgi:hypothetical protein